MLAILFPHMYEDVEYLLTPSADDPDVVMGDSSALEDTGDSVESFTEAQTQAGRSGARQHVNAEAGPSNRF